MAKNPGLAGSPSRTANFEPGGREGGPSFHSIWSGSTTRWWAAVLAPAGAAPCPSGLSLEVRAMAADATAPRTTSENILVIVCLLPRPAAALNLVGTAIVAELCGAYRAPAASPSVGAQPCGFVKDRYNLRPPRRR